MRNEHRTVKKGNGLSVYSQLDFLAIGHITRDVHSDGSFSLGGTVTFAAVTAYSLGLVAGIVTCADAVLVAALPGLLPPVSLSIHPSVQTTTFANQYHDGFRTQYLYAKAENLQSTDIPTNWLDAGIVLFGPLAQELSPEGVLGFPRRPARFSPQLRRAGCDAGMRTGVSGPHPGEMPNASCLPSMCLF